jgi:hypothetical protein
MMNRSSFRQAVIALSLLFGCAASGHAEPGDDPGLRHFRAWLDREHPGYGCDAGPAAFRNRTVEAAYPGQRFYYVLTFTRGIQPPFRNALSLVASVDDSGHVVPFSPGSAESHGRGLKRIASSKDAKLAAAAVLIVASCDPREARWPYAPDRFKVKKNSKGWRCTYSYDGAHSSWVVFDKKSRVLEIGGSAPPVP